MMKLKYLLVPAVVCAVGIFPSMGFAKTDKNHKSHEKQQTHEKNQRKHLDKKHDCKNKSCRKSASRAVPAPLPQLPGMKDPLPTPPKTALPAPRLPANPLDDLIDQTANEAKQKARDRAQ